MHTAPDSSLQYSILNPTGNITALVESPVPIKMQPSAATEIMQRHPEVEQVGFVTYENLPVHGTFGEALPVLGSQGEILPVHGSHGETRPVHGSLRMAGGEFCGNATMSAAALYLLRHHTKKPAASEIEYCVHLRVSGADEPVEVRLKQENQPETPVQTQGIPVRARTSFLASVHMPRPLSIAETTFSHGGVTGTLPFVRMRGISHVLIEPHTPFFRLRADRTDAGHAIREWCSLLEADGLGLMFLEHVSTETRLTPLVYIPGSGTMFWENSCASGSSAVGMILAARAGKTLRLPLHEPGGILSVTSDPDTLKTWLSGQVHLVNKQTLDWSF